MVDEKLEVIVMPLSDVGRAKDFYGELRWRVDADLPFDNGFRVDRLTPRGRFLIVSDVEAGAELPS